MSKAFNYKDVLDSMIEKFNDCTPQGTRVFLMNKKTYDKLDLNGIMFYKEFRIYLDFTVEDNRVLMSDVKVL